LTAAFTGLRLGELLALRWRDVDFAGSVVRVRASYAAGALTTPKSGKVRAEPLAPDVASALAQLRRRLLWVGDDDLVFAGEAGGHLDGSALRRRYKDALGRARLRPLRFHDLRRTFGTRMIAKADIRRVQEWMGHAGHPDHDAISAVRPTERGCRAGRGGVPGGITGAAGGRSARVTEASSSVPNVLDTPRLIVPHRPMAIGGRSRVDPVARAAYVTRPDAVHGRRFTGKRWKVGAGATRQIGRDAWGRLGVSTPGAYSVLLLSVGGGNV
jgi:hypothetical protein